MTRWIALAVVAGLAAGLPRVPRCDVCFESNMRSVKTATAAGAPSRPVGFLWCLTRNAAEVSACVTMRKHEVEFNLQHAGRNVISERFADMSRLLEHAGIVRRGFEESAWEEVI